MRRSVVAGAVVAVLMMSAAGIWYWTTRGHESTDDAQVEAHVMPIAARVGGTVATVSVADNQQVEAGAVLVELDPQDYQLALEHARAELADAEAAAAAASLNVPITTTTTESDVRTARGGVGLAQATVAGAGRDVEAAQAHQATAEARAREQEAMLAKATLDLERLRPLLEKDEIPRQQFDAAASAVDVARAGADAAHAQVREAGQAVKAAESRLAGARVGTDQAAAALTTAETGPRQVTATRARAQAAAAQVKQKAAALKQAEVNLERATLRAPLGGIVSRKSVEVGQVIQPGQPLMTIIALDRVWITANFKETQLSAMRVGQRVTVDVDAYRGRTFEGTVDSIAAATGARFSLLPPENATGNFVKVVQRVPVKIVLAAGQDSDRLLRPGMSVTPTVHTR